MAARPNQDRFIQTSVNGITLYKEEDNKWLADKYKSVQLSFSDSLNVLKSDRGKVEFNIIWNQGATLYEKKKKSLSNYPQQSECLVALIVYTLETPVYKVLNEDTRQINAVEQKDFNNMSYPSMFHLLMHAFQNAQSGIELTLYRGCKGNLANYHKTGTVIYFNQFTSTTADKNTAFGFGDHSTVLFVIATTQKTKFIALNRLSEYPDEQEYLLSPFQEYSVEGTEQIKKSSVSSVTIVRLKCVD